MKALGLRDFYWAEKSRKNVCFFTILKWSIFLFFQSTKVTETWFFSNIFVGVSKRFDTPHDNNLKT